MKLDETNGVVPAALAESGALADASREELAVLLFCLSARGVPKVAEIAKAIGASEARVRASLAYWEAVDLPEGNIREEFAPRLRPGEIRAEGAGEVARAIRDNDLASLMEDYTQYGLSEEYIVTLLSDIVNRSAKGRPTVNRLVVTALRLADKGIETIDALNEYFRLRDERGEWERSVRRILGIYDRALSPTERECFARWTEVYGYADEILTKAYDITVAKTGKAATAYMDKLLTAWHTAGVRTLSECETYEAEHRDEHTAKGAEKKAKKTKERVGTFDPEEAFRLALARSYGSGSSPDGKAESTDGKKSDR